MKALIIDDEQNSAEALEEMLRLVAPDLTVVGKAFSAQEGIEKINAHAPELVFLDIHMPHMTGFEMLEQLGKISFEVVFTTAYDQYALRAFKVAAADYLLKPIDMDELEAAVEKVRQRQRGQSDFGSLEQLFRQMQSQQAEPKRLVLPTSEGLIFLPFEEIVYLQSDSNYTIFYTTHREKIIVSRTLKEFEGVLERHHFFRVHNSFIVNLLQIKRYVRGEGGTVVMRNEAEIEVSRRRKEDFIRKLETSAAN